MKSIRIIYKSLCVLLVIYSVIAGLRMPVPDLLVIGETIRILYYHVGMWFAMIVLLTLSLVSSIIHLRNQHSNADLWAREAVRIAMVFGVAGLITGMIWARSSWGSWWVNDPKLNGAAVCMLAYLAYLVLRGSVREESLRGRMAAVYNILAYVLMLIFMMILPRTAGNSIHPGQGGNPALNPAELDAGMRIVFYPAMIGWVLLGIWILELRVRIGKLEIHQRKLEDQS
jgi:heme exporter protein C